MRTKVSPAFPETALERILDALERELLEATDAEILQAADDLGMKPGMKGSAAFLGLRYSTALRAAQFFGPEWMCRVLSDPRRISLAGEPPRKAEPPQAGPPPRLPSATRPGRRKSPRPPKESEES